MKKRRELKFIKFIISIIIITVFVIGLLISLDSYYKNRNNKAKTQESQNQEKQTDQSKAIKTGQRFSSTGQVSSINYERREVVLKLEQNDPALNIKKGNQVKFKILDSANISDIQNNKYEFGKIKENETLLLLGIKEKDQLQVDVVLVGGLPKPPS